MTLDSTTGLRDLPPALRPRERVRSVGEAAMADAELLALLLGQGPRGGGVLALASELLTTFGGLTGVASRSVNELCAVRGIGPAAAARLKAAFELGRRASSEPLESLGRFCGTADVVGYFRPRLASLDHERLYLVLLDCRNRAFRIELVAQGGLTGLSVHPREILAPAVREAAAGLILVHNHPSGDATPSRADRELTERLARAAAVLGLSLLDHVIVARGGSTSLCGG